MHNNQYTGPEPIKQRFEKFISMEPMTGCWLWTGSSTPGQYGCFNFDGSTETAQRAAWRIYKGLIPEGIEVCHYCDTPGCASPYHIFLGTHSTNVKDIVKKGRYTPRQIKGVLNQNAKLTEEQVLAIREDHRVQRIIACDYGITQAVVSKIKLHQTWKHLP